MRDGLSILSPDVATHWYPDQTIGFSGETHAGVVPGPGTLLTRIE